MRDILHCDMNNFFASVECKLHPELKGYPVAVCGSVEERHGIVLAKNELAKACGVKTAETIASAKSKCRGLITVPPHFEEYLKYSRLARSIYERYTDLVEPFGMDECWLDISGTRRLFGAPEKVADEIRCTVKEELGLTLHPKKIYLQPAKIGVPFLGAYIKPNYIMAGKRVLKNFMQKARGYEKLSKHFRIEKSAIKIEKKK